MEGLPLHHHVCHPHGLHALVGLRFPLSERLRARHQRKVAHATRGNRVAVSRKQVGAQLRHRAWQRTVVPSHPLVRDALLRAVLPVCDVRHCKRKRVGVRATHRLRSHSLHLRDARTHLRDLVAVLAAAAPARDGVRHHHVVRLGERVAVPLPADRLAIRVRTDATPVLLAVVQVSGASCYAVSVRARPTLIERSVMLRGLCTINSSDRSVMLRYRTSSQCHQHVNIVSHF